LGNELKKKLMAQVLGMSPTTAKMGPAEGNLLPPGYAQLTEAATELFGLNLEQEASAAQRTVAAKGFVKTAPIGAPHDRWEYYAAISPGDISQLKSSFEVLCKTVYETDAADQFVSSIEKILSVLTGDTFESREQFNGYFRDRESIPLSSRTILGEGLIELAQTLANPSGGARLKALQKEACRTTVLLQRIDGRQRLRNPFEAKEVNGKMIKGDLTWDESAGMHQYQNAEQHHWVHSDFWGNKTVYVPLSYLPGTPRNIK
jgi:hypothetical protein